MKMRIRKCRERDGGEARRGQDERRNKSHIIQTGFFSHFERIAQQSRIYENRVFLISIFLFESFFFRGLYMPMNVIENLSKLPDKSKSVEISNIFLNIKGKENAFLLISTELEADFP